MLCNCSFTALKDILLFGKVYKYRIFDDDLGILPGQQPRLQSSVSEGSPGQSVPSGQSASIQTRVRVRVPFSHVTVQELKSDHMLQDGGSADIQANTITQL